MKDWLVMPCFAIVEEKNQGGTSVMKTQYYTAATLDGFLATEDDSLAWLFPLGDLDSSSYPAFIAEVGSSMTLACSTSSLFRLVRLRLEAGSLCFPEGC